VPRRALCRDWEGMNSTGLHSAERVGRGETQDGPCLTYPGRSKPALGERVSIGGDVSAKESWGGGRHT
jgi:hypothetical protein